VEDARGRALAVWDVPEPAQAVSPQVAFLLSDVLSDNAARAPAFGENSPLRLSRPAAAKTGTTTDWRDNWTVGYTPNLAVGVWTGNADNSPMREVSGITGAAPVWRDVMESILRGLPVRDFAPPDGMVRLEICADSGLLPDPDCPHRRLEWFIQGKEPTETCDWHRTVRIDRLSGLVAGPNCPEATVEERIYVFWPPEAMDWAREQGLTLPPAAACPLHPSGEPAPTPGAALSLALVSPDPNAVYRLSAALPAALQSLELAARFLSDAAQATVTFYVDGIAAGEDAEPPYRMMWPMQPGEHTIWAVAAIPSGEQFASETRRFSVLPAEAPAPVLN